MDVIHREYAKGENRIFYVADNESINSVIGHLYLPIGLEKKILEFKKYDNLTWYLNIIFEFQGTHLIRIFEDGVEIMRLFANVLPWMKW